MPIPNDTLGKFVAKVGVGGDCWLWEGTTVGKGYGVACVRGRRVLAHRLAWTLLVGPIPDGLMIDHACLTPLCVNPDHLRLATNKQNTENRDPAKTRSKTGVRGVYLDERDGAFYVQVKHNYRTVNGGRFATVEAATGAAEALRADLFTHSEGGR